jgi:hypothetical protein
MTAHEWGDLAWIVLMYVCGLVQGARDEAKRRPRPSTRPPW